MMESRFPVFLGIRNWMIWENKMKSSPIKFRRKIILILQKFDIQVLVYKKNQPVDPGPTILAVQKQYQILI
jgi:hypothetical protein